MRIDIYLHKSESRKKIPEGLPEGSRLFVYRNDKNVGEVYTQIYLLDAEGEWVLERDIEEMERPWRPGEQETFEEGVDRERVIDFFMSRGFNDATPQREYSLMCEFERQLFKFGGHGDWFVEDKIPTYPTWSIRIKRDADLAAAHEEITFALAKMKGRVGERDEYYVDLSEHTYSEHGIFHIIWNGEEHFSLRRTRWGSEDTIEEFSTLVDLLTFVQRFHWSEY